MDIKSHGSIPNEELRSKHKKLRSIKSFINGLIQEVKRVSWTTKDELKLSTKIVIVSIFIFGLGIYVVDLVVKGILDVIGKLA